MHLSRPKKMSARERYCGLCASTNDEADTVPFSLTTLVVDGGSMLVAKNLFSGYKFVVFYRSTAGRENY